MDHYIIREFPAENKVGRPSTEYEVNPNLKAILV